MPRISTSPPVGKTGTDSTPYLTLTGADRDALQRASGSCEVVVVGSLNIDWILQVDGQPDDDSTLRILSETTQLGGHAGNCAAALASLGLTVRIVATVGSDPEGDRLINDLQARGIDTCNVRRTDAAPTGRVFIPLFSDHHLMLMSRGANDVFGPDDAEQAHRGARDAFVMFDPPRAMAEAIAQRLTLHPGSTLTFWNPGGLHAREGHVSQLERAFDTLIVNQHEYSLIDNTLTSVRPPSTRVVTMGAAGSQQQLADGSWLQVRPPRVDVVDPTGAGDAFIAAYVLARLAHLEPRQCLGFANLAGALATTALGARGRLPCLRELVEWQ